MIALVGRILAAAAALGVAAGALAQAYPSKPVRIINPWSPAGPAELLARLVGDKLQAQLGQPFVIESKPGANGTIGAAHVANAAPDGYTLLFSHVGPIAISPAVMKSMPFDPVKDLEPITQVASGALVMLVRPDIPAKTVKEFIAYAKANPGKLSYGSVGQASTVHLAGEMMNLMAGLDLVHVPYKGSAPVVTDMLGGRIALSFLNVAGVMPQIQSGKLRALAVTTLKRSGALPDVPTVADTLPGFEINSWYGMSAPAGTPKDIVALLQREVAKALKAPDVVERLKQLGLDPVGSTPAEHSAQIKDDLQRWAKLAKAANVKVE
jgi:tripartite-type tricarboxylate transporter receptor subunit TctC